MGALRAVDLKVGQHMVLTAPVRDVSGTEWSAGEQGTVSALEYFPHDDGHTVRFVDGRALRLFDDAYLAHWALVGPPQAQRP